ncbi:MAG: hypothetical protein ABFS16_09325 [Bacteroidota bacterium]
MKQFLFLLLLIISSFGIKAQDEIDWTWWNEQHNWHYDDPVWRDWLIISPGYLGPNALPVPDVKRGFLEGNTEIELTASNHFHHGDPTQDISGRLYIPFAQNKIAVEMYGVILEHFAFTEQIRNERFSRVKDGKGFANGDFYFSTLIQIFKDRKFPNTLLRFATKTASGNRFDGARYTDSPGYFFDLSFSKDLTINEKRIIRPIGMIGFYTWQTNDGFNLQNDALLYALGIDFENESSRLSASWSGYSGYKQERDKPMQLNFEWRKDFNKKAIRLQYHHSLRDWGYKTVRFSFIWKLNPVK